MADTQLELYMDAYVKQNTALEWAIHKLYNAQWVLVGQGEPLIPNTDYRLSIRARNNGTETKVKGIRIALVPKAPLNGFYRTPAMDTQPGRGDSPEYPNVLKSGEATPYHQTFFKVKSGQGDGQLLFFGSGVYAEVIPEGHHWRDWTWTFNT